MRKTIIYFLFNLLILSCSAQKNIIDAQKKDVILFNILTDKTSLYSDFFIYNNGNFNVTMNNWHTIGSRYGKYNYTFIKNEQDTMNIRCFCRQEYNIYIKNLEFKKGHYELKFEMPKNKILGSDIETPIDLQKILFKNTYVPDEKPIQKDKYFKDLKFVEINLKDTVNVKLTKIE